MNIEIGLKEILERRGLVGEPVTGTGSWICVVKTSTSEDGTAMYKFLQTARLAAHESKAEILAVIKERDGASGYLLKVLKRIFRPKKVSPKRGVIRYQLDDDDLSWLKGLHICNAGRHAGSLLENEVIAFVGADTIADLRKEGLYTP